MRFLTLCVYLTTALVSLHSETSLAYSADGHESVGEIADSLLKGTKAESKVHAILGEQAGQPLTLRMVSVWPDCVRGVHQRNNGDFYYNPGRYKEKACAIFENKTGTQDMIDYVKRNNSNCKYRDKLKDCHKSYHFADIAIERTSYKTTEEGASDHDVIHAIDAAILVLEGNTAPAPFNIKGKKEALMLLTHFVGDIHQPLHVGAIYLDDQGHKVDPDKGDYNPETNTAGGNLIKTTKNGNLHHEWDTTHFSDNADVMKEMISEARNVKPDSGDISKWPYKWATESIIDANNAFKNISFDPEMSHKWQAHFVNRKVYEHNEHDVQEHEIIEAGARLNEILQTLWPQ